MLTSAIGHAPNSLVELTNRNLVDVIRKTAQQSCTYTDYVAGWHLIRGVPATGKAQGLLIANLDREPHYEMRLAKQMPGEKTASLPTDTKRNIMVVYGTRPEAVKVAPVIKALTSHESLKPTIVVTGQHREMLDQVNEVFGIQPDLDLNLFAHGQSLNELTAKIVGELDKTYAAVEPDAVLVQGDTTTVMAAAIAGVYRNIPIIHLEAGLRSHNMFSPFPEEINRKIVTQTASLHFAPTAQSKANLLAEGVPEELIAVTGNSVIDALIQTVESKPGVSDPRLAEVIDSGRRILLVTTHRRENWGDAMDSIGQALRALAEKYPEDRIVLPLHRNPIVRDAILPHVQGVAGVVVCEPLPYQEFAAVLDHASVVLTDSGGIQEEAPTLGKPVLVLRENTERPEAVEAGTVKLIGTNTDRIIAEVSKLNDSPDAYSAMAKAVNPYGDGRASARCVAAIAEMFGLGERLRDFSV